MGRDELDRWRDALIVDTSDILIESAKRWLGPIKTPFNKHELVSRLEAFLKREANAEAICGLMDRLDRRIVAVVLFCGDARAADVSRLASDVDLSEARAQGRVASLRDRLVLYAYRAGGAELYGVAPPLLDRFRESLSPSDLLVSPRRSGLDARRDVFSSMCALVSMGVHAKPAFRGGSEPSQKAKAMLASSAPELESNPALRDAVIRALERAGVYGWYEGRLAVDPARFVAYCDELGDLAPAVLASSAMEADGLDELDGTLRARLFSYAAAALPPDLATSRADIDRAAAAASRRFLHACATPKVAAALAGGAPYRLGPAVGKALVDLGAACPGDVALGEDSLWRRSSLEAASTAAPRTPSIVVEESHEITVLPEAGASARAFVATIARLEKTGLAWSAVLDKAAVMAAYAYGFDARSIRSRLEALSGRPLPQSLAFSLDAWEADSKSARIRVGVVAVLEGPLAGILERAPGGAELIKERLADGVYLLSANDARDAERLLHKIGVDVDIRALPERASTFSRPSATGANNAIVPAPLAFEPLLDTLVGEEREASLVECLVASLEGLHLSDDARDVLEDKIRARLILDRRQLEALVASGEPVGDGIIAGAMDYSGKVRVVEKAQKEGQAVEFTCVDESGARTKMAGVPLELRKTTNGLLVVIRTRDGTQTLALSAVAKARRLLSSLFGV